MGRIDIHNYEAYLLDFSEGTLGDELQMELELFLIQNPELNIDLSELSLVPFEKEEIHFSEKNNLKKSYSDLISENQFISYIENQLPLKERLNLEKSCVSNPSLAYELQHFHQTIAKAELSITYPNKKELKRRPKVIWFNFSVSEYAAAACILFLIGLFILWPKTGTTDANQLADQNMVNRNSSVKNTSTTIKNKESQPESNNLIANTQAQNSKTQNHFNIAHKNTFSKEKPLMDSVLQSTHEPDPIKDPIINNSLVASNYSPSITAPNTIVETITENEEEPAVLPKKKKIGIWAIASKALKNLNQVGLKSVNGNEDENKDKSSYVLTLGSINIAHKAANL